MKKYNKLLATALISVTLCIVMTCFLEGSKTETKAQKYESIFAKVGDIGERRASENNLTTSVNQKMKVDGKEILITESLYDGSSVRLAYVIESTNIKIEQFPIRLWDDFEFAIDGKTILGSLSAGGKQLDDRTYAGIINMVFRTPIPDSFILELKPIHDKSVDVEIPIKLKGEHKSFEIDKTKKLDNKMITYKSITLYPTVTEITLHNLEEEKKLLNHKNINFKIIDDHGRILQPLRGGSHSTPLSNGKIKVTSNYYFEPLDPIPMSLTIKPFLNESRAFKPKTVRKKWEGKKFKLSQGDAGALTILDVEEKDGFLTVTYKISGDQDYHQAATIWLEDANGTIQFETEPPKQLHGKKNTFKITFSPEEQLNEFYIGTAKLRPLEYIEELETTIELKN